MKEREYYLIIHSISRFIIAMLVILLSSLNFIIDKLPNVDNELISAIQILAVFISSFYLAHLIGMAKAKILFTDDGLVHIWQRKFILSWENNLKISWNIVDNYVFHEDRTFDSFTINLTNGTRYKINRLNIFPLKDDFKRLVIDFPKLSNEYKNGLNYNTQFEPIKEGKSIYSSQSFRWVFYLMSAGFLVLIVTKIFAPNSETSWSNLGVIGSGLLFYGLMIKEQKKNN